MYIALTGTPGTGKTTAAKELASRGYETLSVEEMAMRHNVLEIVDGEKIVDVDNLSDSVKQPEGIVIIEGHLAHFVPCQMCIVLRCHPDIIRQRLEERGYSSEKVKENVEAEAIDIILSEAIHNCQEVFEIDASALDLAELVNTIETIIKGKCDIYSPGEIDWSEVVMEWY